MSFAAEIRDFLAAYQTVSGVLNERSQTRSQNAYRDWLMGAQDRENAGIIDYARTGSDMAPFAPSERFNPDTAGGGGGGGGGGVSAYSSNTYNAPALEQAFADVESYGGKWDARGPVTDSGDRAYGKYQVMGANLPAWTTKYYGKQLSGEEFRYNKEAQQAVFHGEMKRLFDQYGNVKDAASVWFTGRPYSETANTDINDEYTDVDDYVSRVADAYAKYSGEGQVAALAGGDAEDLLAQGDFTVPEGADVDTLTGPGDPGYDLAAKDDYIDPGGAPIPNVVADDLGTSDPDYRRHVTERPVITVPGPMPGTADAVVTETGIEVPGTEPVSTEGAEAVATGGFDPLPQTTGYTDPVSRAGSADAVRQAIDDRSTPPKKILADVLNFGRNIFGGRPRGAVDTGEADPGREAMTAGIGGANVDLVEGIENAIRERDPNVTEDQMPIRVMGTIYNWWMRKGDPNKAAGAAFSIYQTYKQLAQKTITLAQMDASEGNYMDAIEKFMEGYRLVPDGEMLSATLNEDGTYNIETRLEDTGEVIQQTVNVDPKRIVAELMQITPDQFDDLIEQRVLGADAAPETLPSSIETYTEATTPGGAASPDEVIPTTPPPQPGQDTGPMGGTVIPPDAMNVPEGDEAIQLASADPDAPVPAAPSSLPPSQKVRQVPGVPTEPMDPDEFKKFLSNIPERDIPNIIELWKMDRQIWDDYQESLPTAQELQVQEAYSQFYSELAEAARAGEFFDIATSSLGNVPDNEMQGVMLRAAEAHNARLEQLRVQEETAGKERVEALSTDRRQEIEQELFGPEEPGMVAQPVLPGPMPADFRVGTSEAVPSGFAAVPEEQIDIPPEAAALEREDYNSLTAAVNAANEDVDARNTKRFAPPEPLDLSSDAATAQIQALETEVIPGYIQMTTDNLMARDDGTDSPQAQQARLGVATMNMLKENIAKYRLDGTVTGAVLEVLRTPGNVGMSEDDAVGSILSMLTVHAGDPAMAPYTAKHIDDPNMPAGLVEVTVGGDAPFYIPYPLYDKLDSQRATMARDALAGTATARQAATVAGAKQAARGAAASEYLEGTDEIYTDPDYMQIAPLPMPEGLEQLQ